MRLSGWMALIGVLVAVGCLAVTQRNAVYGQGYAVGRRLHRLHAEESDVSRLRAQVTGLESPTRLAQLADERRLKLVAWSTLSPDRPSETDGARLDHIASLNDQGTDTAD
jgi:hypothetical protein